MKDQRSPTPPDDELDAARARIAALEGEATRHRVATAGGKSMAWRRFGKGPPLVLIHGGHGSWLHWVHNIEPLAQRHTLWVPDLPGYGDSDLVESGDVEPIVESVVHSLDALEGRGSIVDLCGFSFGGLVASRVASDRGGVRRLAVIGTAGHGLKSRYRLEMRNWRLAKEPEALWAALQHNLAALMLHDPAAIDALALEVHRASCASTRFRSKTIAREALLRPILDGIDIPVLLIWGEHDVTTHPETAARSIAEGHPERAWRIVPDAGHWAQYEAAGEVNDLLIDWFEDRERSPITGR
ncbi:MAG TPA: alpha/beta fold hydrolase [Usitatibacter sp.]|nr:alpha/beta fold hydrolase [Usitatibacter sp.]